MLAAAPTETPQARPLWQRWPLWVGVGAGVIVVTTTVTLGVVLGSGRCQSPCSTAVFR